MNNSNWTQYRRQMEVHLDGHAITAIIPLYYCFKDLSTEQTDNTCEMS